MAAKRQKTVAKATKRQIDYVILLDIYIGDIC